jgi:hypothetical protein
MDSSFTTYYNSLPRWDPFKKPDRSAPPDWCEESEEFAHWCAETVQDVEADPTPEKVAWAHYQVGMNYWYWYHQTRKEHLEDARLDNHPCLHEVYHYTWRKIQKAALRRPIPGLKPLPTQPLPQVIPEPDPAPQPDVEEVTGIIIGEQVDEAEATASRAVG